METKARGALFQWLDRVWDEFYSVWSPNDCELHIVKHKHTTLNENFIKTLKRLYPEVDFEVTGFGYNTDAFTLFVRDFEILIEPYNAKIYHTDKED